MDGHGTLYAWGEAVPGSKVEDTELVLSQYGKIRCFFLSVVSVSSALRV